MTPEQIEQLRQIGIEHLKRLFEDWSEDVYCASWHVGLERAIWKVANNPENDSMGQASARIVEIAELLGVWFHWPDEADDPVPIPLDEWKWKRGVRCDAGVD